MNTIGQLISGLRNTFKATSEDAFITDRYIFNRALSFAKAIMRRQDKEGKIMMIDSLFDTLPEVELIEIDKIEAGCSGISSNCTIRRTKNPLPKVIEGTYGPIFRMVSPIDYSINMQQTSAMKFVSMSNGSNFKFNKTKYFWYKNGHLYFPNIDWDAVAVEAIYEEPIDKYTSQVDDCVIMQNRNFFLPDYLVAEIEQMVKQQDLSILARIPSDIAGHNSQQILR
jgi:hypothetical protein